MLHDFAAEPAVSPGQLPESRRFDHIDIVDADWPGYVITILDESFRAPRTVGVVAVVVHQVFVAVGDVVHQPPLLRARSA